MDTLSQKKSTPFAVPIAGQMFFDHDCKGNELHTGKLTEFQCGKPIRLIACSNTLLAGLNR